MIIGKRLERSSFMSMIIIVFSNVILIGSIALQMLKYSNYQVDYWEFVRDFMTLNLAILVSCNWNNIPISCYIDETSIKSIIRTKTEIIHNLLYSNYGRKIIIEFNNRPPVFIKIIDLRNGNEIKNIVPAIIIKKCDTTSDKIIVQNNESGNYKMVLYIDSAPTVKCSIQGEIPMIINIKCALTGKKIPAKEINIPFYLTVQD